MTDTPTFPQAFRETALSYWNEHEFYAPDTVALGIDIGIEGIGIAVRKGTDLLYCKTLLVDLPEAQALAARRAKRASRHARKNRRTRMRRLKALFAKHGLPWVNDEVMASSDPFMLRHRAITKTLASREALSICIRSCVLRRGYDYFAMDDDSTGEYPWGAELDIKAADKWIRSAFVDAQMREYLLDLTDSLTEKEDKQEAWKKLVEERHNKAAQEGIPSMLEAYAHKKLNDRKARGFNYPRAHVRDHLETIISRHCHLIDDAEGFTAALFCPNNTPAEKKQAIFRYNRKTPTEAKCVFKRRVKNCPYCSWLGLQTAKCCNSSQIEYRRWALVDFLSVRKFELKSGKLPIGKALLPECAAKTLFDAMHTGISKWSDARKRLDDALKSEKLSLCTGAWNKGQIEQLKDIVTPTLAARKGRAAMSASAAQKMYEAATQGGICFSPESMEQWKQESGLYNYRKSLPSETGIYPQVQTLLGTRKRVTCKSSDGSETGIDILVSRGVLQRIFEKDLAPVLGGKLVPDYCIIETIKNAATNKNKKSEIEKEQKENRARREKQAKAYNRQNASNADFMRMRLFAEQGGSPEKPATCPFTGQELKPSDLFSGEIELAHIYPDARGGLYMVENLVLTTRQVNAAMGNRTPIEAAAANLPGWQSWDGILKTIKSFNWNDNKRKHFTHDTPEFPDFNNLTRTAQLARELRTALAVWLGISGDEEQLRCRIGTPCGVYTAAARRSWLWPEYRKDRSNNLHHRLDAAIMSCLPPEGLNDIRYKGIFESEKTHKGDRVLMCIQGLPLPDFQKMWNDGSVCPIEKKESRSKYKTLGDDSFWGITNDNDVYQRVNISSISQMTAKEVYDTLVKMHIPANALPKISTIEKWQTDNQPGLKDEDVSNFAELHLQNGTPIRKIWKFGKKKTMDKSPLGWSGLPSHTKRFAQLRILTCSYDRLEIWLGWNSKKKIWEYYKRNIPATSALVGLKRMGLPWRGKKNASPYLLEILELNKARDLKEMICGTLPPNAKKIGIIRKGDSFCIKFSIDDESFKHEHADKKLDSNGVLPITTWGRVSAIKSKGKVKISALTHKDTKDIVISKTQDIVNLLGLPTPEEKAIELGMHP